MAGFPLKRAIATVSLVAALHHAAAAAPPAPDTLRIIADSISAQFQRGKFKLFSGPLGPDQLDSLYVDTSRGAMRFVFKPFLVEGFLKKKHLGGFETRLRETLAGFGSSLVVGKMKWEISNSPIEPTDRPRKDAMYRSRIIGQTEINQKARKGPRRTGGFELHWPRSAP
ncbi:MAG TPA: hypothetical protein VJI13_03090 [Candidatus Norongarragalinales archaeon]|nr:hypothetical protein [Candidatus Norongarragalinales archaeon]